MPLVATSSPTAYRFVRAQDHVFAPAQTAEVLRLLHKCGPTERFALETVGGPNGYQLFVRVSGWSFLAQPSLKAEFGGIREAQSKPRDWLLIGQQDYAVARPLTLSRHTVLPIALGSPDDISHRWRAVLNHLNRGSTAAPKCQLGIRLILSPAPSDWRDEFLKSATADNKGRHEKIDPRCWADKADMPSFRAEIQLVAICEDHRKNRRRAGDLVEHLVGRIAELTGNAKIWKRRTRKEAQGPRLWRAHHHLPNTKIEPWRNLDFLSSERDLRFVLSPQEAASLWLAQLAPPEIVDEVLSEPPVEKEAGSGAVSVGFDIEHIPLNQPQVVETRRIVLTGRGAQRPSEPERRSRLEDVGETGSRVVSVGFDIEHIPLNRPAEQIARPATDPEHASQPSSLSTLKDASNGNQRVVHSFRPGRVPVRRLPDRKALTKGRKRGPRAASSRRRDAVAHARPSVVSELDLSGPDIETFDWLGDMPLSTRQDLAYATGLGLATVYASVNALRGRELVNGREVCINGSHEERFWVPEAKWSRVMDDRPLPHTDNTVQRRWLNPEALAAIYRTIGVVTRMEPQRELRAVRWLWSRPLDALVQWSDGWAGFLWVGVWLDSERLARRLEECRAEFGRWGGWRDQPRPGRLFFVTPNAWVSERVWRAVRSRGWAESCTTLDLTNGELIGDLDLGGSQGAIPPFIREEPPPLRADVQRLTGLLAIDSGSRMRRLMSMVEMYPGAGPSHLGKLTGINGAHVKEGLTELEKRKWISQTEAEGCVADRALLASAARRDRVWAGLPRYRQAKLRSDGRSALQLKRVRDIHRVLAKFAESDCPVAPGWMAKDRTFEPNGVVWLEEGPYGQGWHYIVDARRAQRESTLRTILKHALAQGRTDEFPTLLLCQDAMETVAWEIAAGRDMLTATWTRIRSRPVVGAKDNAWLKFGETVPVRGGQRTNAGRKGTDGGLDETDRY